MSDIDNGLAYQNGWIDGQRSAADRIEALTAERDAFRAVLESAGYNDIDGINTVEHGHALGQEVASLTIQAIAERDALDAALAKADELAREAYFVSGAEPLGHYANDQVSMDKSVVTDIMTALTAYRQARDATR